MKRQHLPTLALLTVVLAACPLLGPKDGDRDDDVAEETEAKGDETSPPPGAAPAPETGSGEAGAEALSCEDELSKVTAELAACEAAK